jgi:hypothetical protein
MAEMQQLTLSMIGTFVFLACSASKAWSQRLQYDLSKDQKAFYEYDIQIDTSANFVTYTGIVDYSVTMTNDQLVRLTFQGGLTEQTKPKPNREAEFGSVFPRPPMIPSIFTRSNFAGKSHSKNSIGMTRTGQVLTLDGTSQLPFLLGNLSLIPFEQLPAEETQSWKSDSEVSITDDSNALRYAVRPFGPFAFQPNERMQSASEVTQYKISGNDSGVVKIEKTYEMKTPETGDRESFQMIGKGTWSFDTQDHLPAATDMLYSLTIKEGNTTTAFPIKVKFIKLSAERMAAIQAEAKANQEKSQKLIEERKAVANAPIIGKELEEVLSQLNSTNAHDKNKALIKLMHKDKFDADPKLVEAVRKLANSGDTFAYTADSILQKLDPVHGINKQYEGPGFLESSQLPVDSSTELYVGQIVQIREHGSVWHAGEITDLLSDGKVNVNYRGWGRRKATLLRNQIQLAPKEVTQHKRPEKISRPTENPQKDTLFRTWSDSSGSFSVEAVYLGVDGDKVVLQKADGKELSVTLSRLSLADQRFVAQAQEQAKKLGNPFEP